LASFTRLFIKPQFPSSFLLTLQWVVVLFLPPAATHHCITMNSVLTKKVLLPIQKNFLFTLVQNWKKQWQKG